MGYRIDYGQPADRKYTAANRSFRYPALFCAAVLLFGLTVNRYWPEGRNALRELLLPGSAETTAEAFAEMIGEVREGEPLGDAAADFCREILRGDPEES